MHTHDALMGRRTIHKYAKTPLPEGVLDRALEAALMAPNHRLTHPWRFISVGPKTRAAIADIGVELKANRAKSSGRCWDENTAKTVRGKLMGASALMVVCQVHDPDPHRDREDYATIACAIQNMSLSLWAEGIGSKWSTGAVTQDLKTYKLLGIEDKTSVEIVGFVWIGAADCTPSKAPPRPSIDEVWRSVE